MSFRDPFQSFGSVATRVVQQSFIAKLNRRAALDRTFYFVQCRSRDGSIYSPEREMTDMVESELVKDIATGQIENVQAVFEFNPVESWARDSSEDIASKVYGYCLDTCGHVTNSAADFVSEYVELPVAAK